MSHQICKAYIAGIGAPDKVSQLFNMLAKDLAGMSEYWGVGKKESKKDGEKRTGKTNVTTWPMEPMVPILVCAERPRIPVTGLLPSCESVIEVGKHLILDRPSGWLTLPVNSGGWFRILQQKLDSRVQEHGKQAAINGNCPVLPLCLGLPLLSIDACERQSLLKVPEVYIDETGGWRALPLICWEIEYLIHRPWHHSVFWAPIWKRRLRRAIGISNGNGDIA